MVFAKRSARLEHFFYALFYHSQWVRWYFTPSKLAYFRLLYILAGIIQKRQKLILGAILKRWKI